MRFALRTLLVGGAACIAAPAFAQGAPDVGGSAISVDQDIIVTATRREQNTLQIPAAISAVDGHAIEQKRILDIRDFNSLVPGLQVSPGALDVNLTIRGVGHTLFSPGSENSVALHLDGGYLARPFSANAAFFDVARVEVLRGPQGTLYGRNATGGAVNIISKAPTPDTSGYLSASYGNYDRIDLEGVLNTPIAGDKVLLRLGGYYHSHDGFGKNLPNNKDVDNLNEYGGRIALDLLPSDRLKISLRGHYYHAKDAYGQYHFYQVVRPDVPGALPIAQLLGGVPAPKLRDTNYDTDSRRFLRLIGGIGTIEYELSDKVTLKSLTGYEKSVGRFETDTDGTQLAIVSPFVSETKARQVSEELQLSYKTDTIFALVGAYYFNEKVVSEIHAQTYLNLGVPSLHIPRILPPPFGSFDQAGTVTTDAKALFVNVDWDALPSLTVTAGVRYSTEEKTNAGYSISLFPNFVKYPGQGFLTVNDSQKSHALTPKISVRYEFAPGVNVYASASRGFKSGEYITGTDQYAGPERVWAYETGIKGAFFDRRLRGGISAFYYDYTNLQVQRIETPITTLVGLPKTKVWGVEGEGTLSLPSGFALDGNATFLRSRIGHFLTGDPNFVGGPVRDLRGNSLPYAPKFIANIGAEKRFNFSEQVLGTLRVDFQHTGRTYLDIFNSRPANYRSAYNIVNASAKFDFHAGKYSLLVWGKNLTNTTTVLSSTIVGLPNLVVPTSPGAPPYATAAAFLANLNDPRTYGLTVRYNF